MLAAPGGPQRSAFCVFALRQLRGLPERSPAHTYAGFGIAAGAICVNSKDVVSFAGPPICFRAGGTVVRAVPNWTFGDSGLSGRGRLRWRDAACSPPVRCWAGCKPRLAGQGLRPVAGQLGQPAGTVAPLGLPVILN